MHGLAVPLDRDHRVIDRIGHSGKEANSAAAHRA
jgi:hypothetical protein